MMTLTLVQGHWETLKMQKIDFWYFPNSHSSIETFTANDPDLDIRLQGDRTHTRADVGCAILVVILMG